MMKHAYETFINYWTMILFTHGLQKWEHEHTTKQTIYMEMAFEMRNHLSSRYTINKCAPQLKTKL